VHRVRREEQRCDASAEDGAAPLARPSRTLAARARGRGPEHGRDERKRADEQRAEKRDPAAPQAKPRETRRGEVIDYVQQRYGREQVAQIITFGKMKARAVLKDVNGRRWVGMSGGEKTDRNHLGPGNPWGLSLSTSGCRVDARTMDPWPKPASNGSLFADN
jgi:hypothetical protein